MHAGVHERCVDHRLPAGSVVDDEHPRPVHDGVRPALSLNDFAELHVERRVIRRASQVYPVVKPGHRLFRLPGVVDEDLRRREPPDYRFGSQVISKGFEEDPDGLVVTFLHEFRHDGGARLGKHGCALIRVWRPRSAISPRYPFRGGEAIQPQNVRVHTYGGFRW